MDKQKAIKLVKTLYFSELEFCGCGSKEDILEIIRLLLEAIRERCNNEDWDKYENTLMNVFGYKKPLTTNCIGYLLYTLLLEILNTTGILCHSSNIDASWMTPYGEEILEALNAVKDDYYDVFDE